MSSPDHTEQHKAKKKCINENIFQYPIDYDCNVWYTLIKDKNVTISSSSVHRFSSMQTGDSRYRKGRIFDAS